MINGGYGRKMVVRSDAADKEPALQDRPKRCGSCRYMRIVLRALLPWQVVRGDAGRSTMPALIELIYRERDEE